MSATLQGNVLYFRSRIDGRLQPCAVCATGAMDDPVPLILEVSPGASSATLQAAVELTEEIAGIAARAGKRCVVLRPTGRGPGSLYQNYGEVDLFEAMEHVCSLYPIDRDRISITGSSMGGAATWYLVSHYPDVFSAAAPFCGYCDYRLWEKPGGLTFYMHPWEEPSWQARSAAMLVENLEHTRVWVVHGEWDRSVGGGVPVAHSEKMARLLGDREMGCRLTVVPETGHGCRIPELWPEVVLWLLTQKKPRDPSRVTLASYGLRHNRSYGVRIEQLHRYSRRGMVQVETAHPDRIAVGTENVRAIAIGPIRGASRRQLVIDDQDLGLCDVADEVMLQKDANATWSIVNGLPPGQKRPGCSGPIGDMFFDGTVLVPGTIGTKEETFFNDWVARHASGYFAARNGGVHRGGIMGRNTVDLPVVRDTDLSDRMMRDHNLLLYGTAATNAILRRFAHAIPVRFDAKTICAADRSFTADRAAVMAVFPHPLSADRYIAVHGGVAPDSITWGSHFDMLLLPDYIVYAGGDLLEWGFWDSDWKAAAQRLTD